MKSTRPNSDCLWKPLLPASECEHSQTMNRLKAALTSTGGLSYHYMALRYRSGLWRRFHENLNVLLCNWRHFSKEIILIGPSAGYSLSQEFLQTFEAIHIYDPDPLARWLFQRRFPRLPIHWSLNSPFFCPSTHSIQSLWRIRRQHPEAALLFCNVIGQWPLMEKVADSDIQEFVDQLHQVYTQSNWASFHDLFSGPSHWKKWSHIQQRQQVEFHSLEALKQFWKDTKGGPLTDHMTFKKFKSTNNKKHLIWPLTPRQIHIVEWAQG